MQEVIKTFPSIFCLYFSKNFLNKEKKSFLTLFTFPRTQRITLCLMDLFVARMNGFHIRDNYFI